jgi:hypothetical protein
VLPLVALLPVEPERVPESLEVPAAPPCGVVDCSALERSFPVGVGPPVSPREPDEPLGEELPDEPVELCACAFPKRASAAARPAARPQ